jgi:hypothetical protein
MLAGSGAVAVTYNLTITQTIGAGNLALYRYGDPFPGVSSINWVRSNEDLANGGVVGLGSLYYANVLCGGLAGSSTHLVVDVTGYHSYA